MKGRRRHWREIAIRRELFAGLLDSREIFVGDMQVIEEKDDEALG